MVVFSLIVAAPGGTAIAQDGRPGRSQNVSAAASPAAASPAAAGAGQAQSAPFPGGRAPAKPTNLPPKGPNPYLALVPDPDGVDHAGWQRYLAARSGQLAEQRRAIRAPGAAVAPTVREREPVDVLGRNDTRRTAQAIPTFGTASGRSSAIRILGTLATSGRTRSIPAGREDDGSIPLATETGIVESGGGITAVAMIGDGPHGSAMSGSGDFDVYALSAQAGALLTAQVAATTGELDPMVAVYSDAGDFLAFNDDANGLNSALQFTVPMAGRYFVLASGFPVLPLDPFDSGSGSGSGSEGEYQLTLQAGPSDADVYALRLRKGDVLGVSVSGGPVTAAIQEPSGQQVMGSRQDLTSIYPATTPLPGGGFAVADHVADRSGLHYLVLSGGRGAYEATVEAYRPGLEASGAVQTLFLDFDGARLNTNVFGGPGVRTLSPLRAFLPAWGLKASDLDAVIDGILAEVTESLERDLAAAGINPRLGVKIRNSRDHGELFGRPNVSRVVIGGTVQESGIPTIGIAQSIDPGNFEAEESALILLDLLSDPGDPNAGYSLNTYLRPRSDRVGFIGQAVGHLVAHEAGHMIGNWHVDAFNQRANLMDRGGNFAVLFGVGADGVGGTADDRDVDFGEDELTPEEGFIGLEDTLSRTAFGLSG